MADFRKFTSSVSGDAVYVNRDLVTRLVRHHDVTEVRFSEGRDVEAVQETPETILQRTPTIRYEGP
jgi:hypothetical protein